MPTATFYPDTGNPGTASVDGFVSRTGVDENWATITSGAGNDVDGTTTSVGMTASSTADGWNEILRSIFTFNTSSLGARAIPTAATLYLYRNSKADTLGVAPSFNIYGATPASGTTLVAADYGQTGSTPFSTAIGYADVATGYNTFELNIEGLAAISTTGVTKLSCRVANYDVTSVAPTWSSGQSSGVVWASADFAGTSRDPKLVITYSILSADAPYPATAGTVEAPTSTSSSSTSEFTCDQILTMAYRLCGVLEHGKSATAADLSAARQYAQMELASLQAEGQIVRTIERTTLALIEGISYYELPDEVIDIKLGPNDQVGTIVPDSGSETLVTAMTRAEYLDISNKSSDITGRPTRALIEKLARVRVTFWPFPDDTCVSFRYARIRNFADLDSGSVTIDLPRRWMKYLTYAIGAHIARAKSLGKAAIKDMEEVAERSKAIALADDNERGKVRFRLAHSGRHF